MWICAIQYCFHYNFLRLDTMFHFQDIAPVPDHRHIWKHDTDGGGGGLVKVEDRVVWLQGETGVMYELKEENNKWKKLIGISEKGATLAVWSGNLLCVGGWKDGDYSKKIMVPKKGKWYVMTEMLLGCSGPCVVSISDCLVVIGGSGIGNRIVEVTGGLRYVTNLTEVQVYDGKTWKYGPQLPQQCHAISAVAHGDLIFVLAGGLSEHAAWCLNITDLVRLPSIIYIYMRLPSISV